MALNMGMPTQTIFPPDVVHTIRHLMISHKYHTKEPEGSSWKGWISIMERYFAEKEKKPEDRQQGDTAHRKAVELSLPVCVHYINGPLPHYYLEP
ncbi:MAG: hypothetical protein IJ899_08890 [Blautia sp.]|nr:hypothetical protein [Blautia sp.]